ncbi:hypothetical protein E2C01_005907 [Portunus trituberculatus]|uniref:Uncharacterized protein n=1 Tax=Portunus trituberculatus TaxID=210409 RepID=A0A5B7CWP9_PORTR|nr:hypothetical protein [Portunus trituberculatus]
MWSEVARDPMCDVMLSRGHGGGQGRFTLQNLILGHQFASKLSTPVVLRGDRRAGKQAGGQAGKHNRGMRLPGRFPGSPGS